MAFSILLTYLVDRQGRSEDGTSIARRSGMGTKDESKKKAGQDTGKKRQRMRAAVAERQAAAAPKGKSTDEVDKVKYKRGSAGDRTVRQ